MDAEGNGIRKIKPVGYGLSELMAVLEGAKRAGIYMKKDVIGRKFIDFELKYDKKEKRLQFLSP
ncbi:MAG: hypothetical protein ACUVUG_02215 [Candidatus Aminicenantia bacterium]